MEPLILTATKGSLTKVIFGPAIPSVIGAKKRELTKSGNWKGWILKMQYAVKKELTYEQKVARMKGI